MKNVNYELLELQKKYIQSKDQTILGQMMRKDLLPHIAEVHLKLLLSKLKRHYCFEDVYNMYIDCSLKVIEHIEQGKYVNKSFTYKMKWVAFNYLRKLDADNKKNCSLIIDNYSQDISKGEDESI